VDYRFERSKALGKVVQVLHHAPLAGEVFTNVLWNARRERDTLNSPRVVFGELPEKAVDMSVENRHVACKTVRRAFADPSNP
jgi:hypothetical protein